MPGVVVTTSTRSGPAGAPPSASGQAFFVGLAERGSTTDPILVRNMADVARKLGDRPNYGALYDQLNVFFQERGSQAYVARVVGAAATVGSVTLNDKAGTPVPTLRIDAANAGSWSSRVKVQVRDGANPNTFRITVYLDDVAVEDVTNISSPNDAVAKFAESNYIRAVNLSSATVEPNNNPVNVAATALTAGTDARAGLTSADYVSALDRFNAELGDGAVAIPGNTDGTTWAGIQAHCEATNRVGALSEANGATATQLKTSAASLGSEHVGLFAPWIVVGDGAGGQRTISPEGYVLACRSRAHQEAGPHRVPGGAIAVSRTILGLQQTFNRNDADELDMAKVNIIRKIGNSFRLYGWRSTSRDSQNYALLKDRDVLNRIVVDAEARLEQFVFQPIDGSGHLLAAVNAELRGMLEPLRQANALYENYDAEGNLIDPGYIVNTGRDINTAEVLANNELRAVISVRVSPAAALINLNIVKVGFTGAL